MAFKPDQFRAGQVLSARALNEFVGELERLGKIQPIAPVTLVNEEGGLAIGVGLGEVWWIELTSGGTGGKYAWKRKQGVTGGTWIDHPGGRTGTTSVDPVIESTGKTDVPTGTTKVYEARRDPVSRGLIFTAGSC